MHHFIEDEIIRGYEDPKLDFYFTPITMDCYFNYTWKSRSRESINLETLFYPFFINSLITERDKFEEKLAKQSEFEVPAKVVGQLHKGDSTFYTYVVEDVTEPRFNKYMLNFQIFLKFFIETGSYIDDTDPIWKIILMIEKVSFIYTREAMKEHGSASYPTILSIGTLRCIDSGSVSRSFCLASSEKA